MKKKDVLECLISLLSSEQPPEVHDEAAFALSNYAKDCKPRVHSLYFHLLPSLKLYLLFFFSNLVGNKSLIRKLGGIGALVNLLESTDPDVKKNVALALAIVLEDCKK